MVYLIYQRIIRHLPCRYYSLVNDVLFCHDWMSTNPNSGLMVFTPNIKVYIDLLTFAQKIEVIGGDQIVIWEYFGSSINILQNEWITMAWRCKCGVIGYTKALHFTTSLVSFRKLEIQGSEIFKSGCIYKYVAIWESFLFEACSKNYINPPKELYKTEITIIETLFLTYKMILRYAFGIINI